MRSRTGLFWRSVRHTPLPQLLHRVRLETQRRGMRLLRGLGWNPGAVELPAAEDPPQPRFPPRTHLVRRTAGVPELQILNRSIPLLEPFDWHLRVPQLDRVTLHYMEYLEALDDGEAQRLMHRWIEHNPPYGPGYWRDAWNSYALSLRCLIWMQQLAVRAWPEEIAAPLRNSLAAQIGFLAANLELDLGGNHLLKNLKALLWARRFFRGLDGLSARAEAVLARELDRQVLADGVHFERAPAYHLQVFADLLECYQVLGEGPLQVKLAAALDAMAQAAADLCHPDGLPSLFNDGGLHMAYEPAACLEVYHRLRGRRPVPRSHFAYSEAGYFGLRGPDSLLLVDCGALGPDGLPAHGHGDCLAFEWSAGGRRLLVDTGVFEYQEGAKRAHARATLAHNTLTLDGADQAEFWKSFRVGRRARPTLHHLQLQEGQLELEGSHDGYAHLPGRPVHRRRIEATLDRVEVRDTVVGGIGQRAEARLLLHPDVHCTPEPGGARLEYPGGQARLRSSSPMRMEEAPWWPDFGVEIATIRIVLDYGSAPLEAGFSLVLEEPHPLDKLEV